MDSVKPSGEKIKFKLFIYIVPLLYLAWFFMRSHLEGPFYLTRIDPHYPYLLNGLNCALFEFDRIGHIDHPGTPLQIITGIFIRITHLIAGEGNIADDVINNPEKYLQWSSFYLALIATLILIWLGKITFRNTKNYFGTIIIQSSLFLHPRLMETAISYDSNRVLPYFVLILTGLCLKFIYDGKFTETKFAIYSGVCIGIAFITKINFLPLIIIPPVLMWKLKGTAIFSASFLLSGAVSILPIHNKINNSFQFFKGIFKHDGLYGSGNQQFINIQDFFENMSQIIRHNPITLILFFVSLTTVMLLIIKPAYRKNKKNEFRIINSSLFISLLGSIIVAKHYKEDYILPFIALNGFILFTLRNVISGILPIRLVNIISGVFLLLFLSIPSYKYWLSYPDRSVKLQEHQYSAQIMQKIIGKDDYLLIEPTWLSGPFIENSLIFGITYVANKHIYYNSFRKYYPRLISFEGQHNPWRFFRMPEVESEAIFKSGKDLYVYSSPGRNAHLLEESIYERSNLLGISMQKDTVFSNVTQNEFLYRFKNTSEWKTIYSGNCGFEQTMSGSSFTDDGEYQLYGNFVHETRNTCNGNKAIKLDSLTRRSPSYVLGNIAEGDYLVFTIGTSLMEDGDQSNRILKIRPEFSDMDSLVHTEIYNSDKITPDWYFTRLSVKILKIPKDTVFSCFFEYSGDKVIYADDFSIDHYSNR